MLQELLRRVSVEWRGEDGESEALVVLADEGAAELLKWNSRDSGVLTGELGRPVPLLPLELTPEGSSLLTLFRPRRLLFLITSPLFSLESHGAGPGSEMDEMCDKKCARDLVFAALKASSSSQNLPHLPPEALLLTTSSLELLDQYADQGISPSSTSTHLPLYNKSLKPLLPCRWLNARSSDSLPSSCPTAIKVIHWTSHALHILDPRPKDPQQVGLFILASPCYRKLCPLTLHSLGAWDPAVATEQSVNHAVAEDLSGHCRATLKHLSHELAGAVVFNLGLDPTNSVFAMGKTSELVGHTLQPLLGDLMHERKMTSENSAACRPASLLLVDRSCDLFTPTQHNHGSPLAHRILAMLPRRSNATYVNEKSCRDEVDTYHMQGNALIDVAVKQQLPESSKKQSAESVNAAMEVLLPSFTQPRGEISLLPKSVVGDGSAASVLLFPLSALSQLSLPLMPSLCPLRGDTNFDCDKFMHAMFASSEEKGRYSLELLLQKLISQVNPNGVYEGTSLKKKKGLGAEMLNLVNFATVRSREADNANSRIDVISNLLVEDTIRYNPAVVNENAALFSWALAIIETMQRSSDKQLTAHLRREVGDDCLTNAISRSSFELRAAREEQVLSHLCHMAKAGTRITPAETIKVIMEASDLTVSADSKEYAVKDIKHILTLTISIFALLGADGYFNTSTASEATSMGKPKSLPLTQEDFQPLAHNIALCIIDYSPLGDILDLSLLKSEVVLDIADFRYKRRKLSQDKSKDVESDEVKQTEQVLKMLSADIDQWRMRLLNEVEDEILSALGIVHEISLYCPQAPVPKHDHVPFESREMFNSACKGAATTPSKSGTHKIVRTKGSKRSDSSSQPPVERPVGVLARILYSTLSAKSPTAASRLPATTASINTLDTPKIRKDNRLECVRPEIKGLVHIENPLFSFARAGLGMISQGLGSWGFGSASPSAPTVPHPSDHRDLVIFVVGGISSLEVQQLQEQLELLAGAALPGDLEDDDNEQKILMRVFIGSTDIIGTEDVYLQTYIRMRYQQ